MTPTLDRVDVQGVALCFVCESPLEIRCPEGHDPLPVKVGDANLSATNRQLRSQLRQALAFGAERQKEVTHLTRDHERLSRRVAELARELDSSENRYRAARPLASVGHGPEGTGRKPSVFREKTCACGATFTPTAPRDNRCQACRSGGSAQ